MWPRARWCFLSPSFVPSRDLYQNLWCSCVSIRLWRRKSKVTPQESVTQWQQRSNSISTLLWKNSDLTFTWRPLLLHAAPPSIIISTGYCIYVYEPCFQSLLITHWIGSFKIHRIRSYKGIHMSSSLFPYLVVQKLISRQVIQPVWDKAGTWGKVLTQV